MRDSAPRHFGRTPAQSVRGAVLLALLGGAAVWAVARLLASPRFPLAGALGAVPTWLLPAVGGAASLAIAALGLVWSLRQASRFEVTPGGLTVTGPLGRYTVSWINLTQAAAVPGGGLGLKVVDRDALVSTHAGSAQQREWLRTQPPFGEWDLLFPAADLGVDVNQALAWMAEAQPGGNAAAGDG